MYVYGNIHEHLKSDGDNHHFPWDWLSLKEVKQMKIPNEYDLFVFSNMSQIFLGLRFYFHSLYMLHGGALVC